MSILSFSTCSFIFFCSIGDQKETSLEKSETASKEETAQSTDDLCGAVDDLHPASGGESHSADERPLVVESPSHVPSHVIMSQDAGDTCSADAAIPQQQVTCTVGRIHRSCTGVKASFNVGLEWGYSGAKGGYDSYPP